MLNSPNVIMMSEIVKILFHKVYFKWNGNLQEITENILKTKVNDAFGYETN